MTAAESPQDAARRIREDAARRSNRSAAAGRGGAGQGRRAAGALASLPPGWSTVRASTPSEPEGEEVVVAVGPAGIFVVASRGAAEPEAATAGTLEAQVATLSRWARRVHAVCGPHGHAVQQVLCLPDQDTDAGTAIPSARDADGPVGPPSAAQEVLVCRSADLVRTLTSGPVVLAAGEVADAALRVEVRLRSGARGSGESVPPGPDAREPVTRLRRVVQVVVAALLLLGLLLAAPRIADGLAGTLAPAGGADRTGP